jgi:hypothetical protein
MFAGLSVALALAAEAPATVPQAAPPPQAADDSCSPRRPTSDREVVICAEKPQGYRIDPDILEAKRQARNHTRPKPPNKMADTSCTVVGPAPCMGAPMINLIGAALTAMTMAEKAMRGENVGRMFITDPQPTEYELYKEAKARREAEEAERAAKAKAKASDTPSPAH